MNPDWNIRKYSEGDESAIIELLKTTFPFWGGRDDAHALQYWRWKYKDNPLGFFPSSIGLYEHGNKLVGHFGIIPRRMKVGNSVMGALMADAATHPDYRGQGIYLKLAKQVLTEAKTDGIKIAYAFYLGSRILTLKLPWASHEQIPSSKLRARSISADMQLMKIMNIKRIAKIYTQNSLLAKIADVGFRPFIDRPKSSSTMDDLEIRKVKRFDERHDKFWMKASKGYDMIVERSSEYLNWRYMDVRSDIKYTVFAAEKKNQIKGYIVLRRVNQGALAVGTIVDILTLPDQGQVATSLISKSLEFLKARNVDLVGCRMLKSHPYYKILRNRGFLQTYGSIVKLSSLILPSAIKKRYLPSERNKPHFNICINSPETNMIKILSQNPSEKWILTYGDGDEI